MKIETQLDILMTNRVYTHELSVRFTKNTPPSMEFSTKL